ncbi:hypothetical protein CU102_12555 [Phyllobacterium brassicacearum]|uniref:DNA 3'-5' helicase II n=1 Tax=Phyllobacterium brassicacearum TaxID=314235 RepID=A0A2P7BQ29_9HYPH|nr:NERD domain-containing protein [Phyllobacterium brassicacearum]PSH68588.1 hypothetical protein CU102_12555 [Phyllobacterium brassicacearum]TDQ24136.1 PhoH-like protein [Phyllobacterium brassicacearum]
MARMWPAVLPAQIREDALRSAEVRVYDLLEKKLGSGWVVFYSRPWLGLSPTGEEKDGECDFVVLHPAHGYLTIEVKGGGISFDPEIDRWLSTDRHRIRRIIKNPIRQAVSSKHELLKQAKRQKHWPVGRKIRMRHGVVFTDTIEPPHNLGADGAREIFCCRNELDNIDHWVRERLSGGMADDLGGDGVRAFEELLASPFLLRAPLGHYLDDDDRAINTLTPQQFHILDAVGHLSRVAAGGGAGTGKTIVAIEDAVRLARQGLKTALICLSRPLAAHIKERLANTESTVAVFALPDLCAYITGQVCGEGETQLEKAIERMLAHIRGDLSLRFEALIVDEAQDFRTHWWIALEEILAQPETAILHAFFDTNQSVYGDIVGELTAFRIVPIHLTRNLRNTRNIHNAASLFYRGIPVTADGPEGIAVEWNECASDRLSGLVVDTVRRLIIQEKIAPEDIAILGVNASVLSSIRNRSAFPEGVQVEQVRAFKGLERRVVVLAATREIADEPELAYVSLSRARAHLVVFGEPEILSWLRKA